MPGRAGDDVPLRPVISYTATMELRGASALVTGAGRGIGRAIAGALGGAGAAVTVVSRTRSDLDETARAVQEAGGRVAVQVADVRKPAECEAAIARAVIAHGGLQVLVNNAGIGSHGPIAETSDEQWSDVPPELKPMVDSRLPRQ